MQRETQALNLGILDSGGCVSLRLCIKTTELAFQKLAYILCKYKRPTKEYLELALTAGGMCSSVSQWTQVPGTKWKWMSRKSRQPREGQGWWREASTFSTSLPAQGAFLTGWEDWGEEGVPESSKDPNTTSQKPLQGWQRQLIAANNTCTWIFIFPRAKKKKQSKCPSTEEWINKRWYIH